MKTTVFTSDVIDDGVVRRTRSSAWFSTFCGRVCASVSRERDCGRGGNGGAPWTRRTHCADPNVVGFVRVLSVAPPLAAAARPPYRPLRRRPGHAALVVGRSQLVVASEPARIPEPYNNCNDYPATVAAAGDDARARRRFTDNCPLSPPFHVCPDPVNVLLAIMHFRAN